MSNTKILNYPGVLRAFNKIEEAPEIEDKVELLSALSNLIDRVIQKDLEQVRYQCKTVSKSIAVSEAEVQKLLIKLKESDIVLYESMSNEQALVANRHYCFSGNKISSKPLKGRVYSIESKK